MIKKSDFNTAVQILVLIILGFLCRTVYQVSTAVDEIHKVFDGEVKEVLKQGSEYAKEEYSDEAKEIGRMAVDSTKSKIKQFFQ